MNAKCRLLCLREMFIKYTDQNNYVSMKKIQNYLNSYGYPAHQVTIKDDIDALISSGMEIEYIHIKRFNLEIEKAYAIGLTAIHIHSFPYLLEEFIDSLYY